MNGMIKSFKQLNKINQFDLKLLKIKSFIWIINVKTFNIINNITYSLFLHTWPYILALSPIYCAIDHDYIFLRGYKICTEIIK